MFRQRSNGEDRSSRSEDGGVASALSLVTIRSMSTAKSKATTGRRTPRRFKGGQGDAKGVCRSDSPFTGDQRRGDPETQQVYTNATAKSHGEDGAGKPGGAVGRLASLDRDQER